VGEKDSRDADTSKTARVFSYSGGTWPLTGNPRSSDEPIEIGLDMTELLAGRDESDEKFFFSIRKKFTNDQEFGEVLSLSVLDYRDYQMVPREYTCIDYPVMFDESLYIQIAEDAKYNVSCTNVIYTEEELHIYPNPARERVTISYIVGMPGQVLIQIFDYKGIVMHTYQTSHSSPGCYRYLWMTNNSLIPGVYHVRVVLPDRSYGDELILL
jgi:hypothetical protein